MYERGGLNHPPSEAPQSGQPCLRVLPSGEHQPGWLIADASNPHAITIEKLGQSTYRVRNLRWGVDLLPADSPFPAPPAAESQPSASIPPNPSTPASEPHTAAADDHPYGF